MCRGSSPCTYSWCEANSTLKPMYGLRCRPCRKPSTTDRARSSMLSRREKNSGSASSRVSIISVLGHQPCVYRTCRPGSGFGPGDRLLQEVGNLVERKGGVRELVPTGNILPGEEPGLPDLFVLVP